ncbi:hypothetical protein SAMN05443144_1242 [Fodinibius roseus]|uniref:Uncharacterized protein n=1 Tax=Fodinibius roseus TaxID=1194090 RepID=A0A1M5IMR3_9BACT|nr:hypothetical protein SAMN05443144_1242 [Fodinibius roseus]
MPICCSELGVRHKAARIEMEYLPNIEYPYLFWSDEIGGKPKIVRGEQEFFWSAEGFSKYPFPHITSSWMIGQ